MRLIILQTGTPSYEVAKTLSAILKKHIPGGFMVYSTDEFLSILCASGERHGLLSSLNIESL